MANTVAIADERFQRQQFINSLDRDKLITWADSLGIYKPKWQYTDQLKRQIAKAMDALTGQAS